MITRPTKLFRLFWRVVERYGPVGQAALVVLVGAIILIPLRFIANFNPVNAIIDFAAVVGMAIAAWVAGVIARNRGILIEITTAYISSGDSSLIDKLLGKLISGTWHREEIRPGDALFRVLENDCDGAEYERKRRIAEALPMLSVIDLRKTVRLLRRLRGDYEPQRWRSDIRRRTVEALVLPIPGQDSLLIDRISYRTAKEGLTLRQGDEVYVAMATVEALAAWKEQKEENKTAIVQKFQEFCKQEYSQPEQDALDILSRILELSKASTAHETMRELRAAATNSNLLVQVAAARNVMLCATELPLETLQLIRTLLQETSSEKRNVRRPLARENVIEFIIRSMRNRQFKDESKAVYESLLFDDPESIIRITAFDKVELLGNVDANYARQVCNRIIANESEEELRKRAERVLSDMS